MELSPRYRITYRYQNERKKKQREFTTKSGLQAWLAALRHAVIIRAEEYDGGNWRSIQLPLTHKD